MADNTGGMYDNTNRGSLFRNKRKEKENHPDHTGSLNVMGIEYWVSAWVKVSKKDGSKFFSLAVTPKDKSQQLTGSTAPPTTAAGLDLDEDVPF